MYAVQLNISLTAIVEIVFIYDDFRIYIVDLIASSSLFVQLNRSFCMCGGGVITDDILLSGSLAS